MPDEKLPSPTRHPLHGVRVFCVERRSTEFTDTLTADSMCYVGSSVESCQQWFRVHTDYEPARDPAKPWWWAIIVMYIDSDFFDSYAPGFEENGTVHSYYDWDGNELPEQPLP